MSLCPDEQWHTQERLVTPEQIKHWREIGRRIQPAFTALVENQGLKPSHAPEMPRLVDGMDVPHLPADDPVGTMDRFTAGLRKVLAAQKRATVPLSEQERKRGSG